MLNRFTVYSRGPDQEVKETPALQSSVMETDQSWSVETCVGLSVATMEVQTLSLHCYIRKMQMNSITCFGDQRRPCSAHCLTPMLSTCSLSVTMWREQWQPVSKKTLWSPTEADLQPWH